MECMLVEIAPDPRPDAPGNGLKYRAGPGLARYSQNVVAHGFGIIPKRKGGRGQGWLGGVHRLPSLPA